MVKWTFSAFIPIIREASLSSNTHLIPNPIQVFLIISHITPTVDMDSTIVNSFLKGIIVLNIYWISGPGNVWGFAENMRAIVFEATQASANVIIRVVNSLLGLEMGRLRREENPATLYKISPSTPIIIGTINIIHNGATPILEINKNVK